jgi:hypothetical protein
MEFPNLYCEYQLTLQKQFGLQIGPEKALIGTDAAVRDNTTGLTQDYHLIIESTRNVLGQRAKSDADKIAFGNYEKMFGR